MTYHHLSQEERYLILALLKAGLTQAQISLNLGRHKSTISREVSRMLVYEVINQDRQAFWVKTERSIAGMPYRLQIQIGFVLKPI